MLSLISPINSLGYGVTSLNILKALSKYTPVALFPIGHPDVHNQDDFNICQSAINNAKLFDDNAPCIRIWHQNQMDQFVGHGEKVGFPIFELDQFSHVEHHHLSRLDRIFVASHWAKEVLISNKVPDNKGIPINVIPLGVDTDTFLPVAPNPDANRPTVFFTCGKWEVRKGHDILIQAFSEAFSEQDNVELWMMCDNPFNSEEENQRWLDLYNHPKVRLINRVQTHQEVYNIMSHVDCGIFLSRAEGWNLEALEMLACGKHIIITGYSAHNEFCDDHNAMIVEIDETEIAYDNKWFFGQGSWAKIGDNQIKEAAYYMAKFHEQRITDQVEINTAGIETAKKFTWDNSAKEIMAALNV